MSRCYLFLLVLTVFVLFAFSSAKHYEPNWNSLDSRPLPAWYDESKLGIFIHWSVFSVPSYKAAWFWYLWKVKKDPDLVAFMKNNYPPDFTYPDFASMFTAEFFDANYWADLLKASGAKFFILVTKHHEGFTNWPSPYSFNWNAMDVGPKRDLVGELVTAVRQRASDVHVGLYHSLFEFMNPLFLRDQANHFKTRDFVESKTMPELYELVRRYKPDLVHTDGDWMAPDTYWNSTGFLAWLYNDSPVKDKVIVSDAWGINCSCRHGGYKTCGDEFDPSTVQNFKFQNQMRIDKKAWLWRRDATSEDFLTIQELIPVLAQTVSCGGNLAMNIGPRKDGRIDPIYEERLRQMGAWLQVNGEAIYKTRPYKQANDTVTPKVWYTTKKEGQALTLYAILLEWPDTGLLKLGRPAPSPSTQVTMLGVKGQLTWSKGSRGGMVIEIPPLTVKELPSLYAWVLKITDVQ